MHISLEMGSTHMGKKEYIREFLEESLKYPDSSVKFQLFPNESRYTKTGNVYLTKENFDYAYHFGKSIGVKVTASVFEQENNDFLLTYDVPYVKFAYSRNHRIDLIDPWLKRGTKVVITSDFMTKKQLPKGQNIIHLWTSTVHGQTLYPNHFQIDYHPILTQYDGISDHSLQPMSFWNQKLSACLS